MLKILFALTLLVGGTAAVALAQKAGKPAPKPATARIDRALKAAFAKAPKDWAARLAQDLTMQTCTAYRNQPPEVLAAEIAARERAAIRYPADGKLLGDWKNGERLAQSGYGMRFTDYPPSGENGGNCYACHRLSAEEASYGTIGVNLKGYGQIKKFGEAEAKAVYEKIYNSHASHPCSLMPRFGANGVLTIEQIKDLVALLMDPDSPVNK